MKKFYVLLIVLFFSLGFHRCEQAPEPVQPTACFTPSKSTASVNELITFTNCSTDALKYGWDFDDGKNSDKESPTHSYTSAGQFTVKLRAYNGTLNSETEQTIIITDNAAVTACFSMSPSTSAGINQIITFTNCSTGATSYSWDFGDGTTNSPDQNPTHQYSNAGNFTIELTASNGSNSDKVSKQINITSNVVACFTSDKNSAVPGETINFTNCSTNADSYSWDFGDGNSSTAKDPSYSYSSAGTYTVNLTAIAGSNSDQVSKQITISETSLPVACFTVISQNVAVGESITFTNCSQNADSYEWNFGDGGTSTDMNPTYSYSGGGNFTVTLTAIKGGDQNQFSLVMNVAGTASVEINVNMNVFEAYGLFDPWVDFVDVAGTFNNWDPTMVMTDNDGDGIYTITIPDLDINSTIEYKFRINGDWNNSEFPLVNGGGNRIYTVVAGSNIVNHYFNDESTILDPTVYDLGASWIDYYTTDFDNSDGWYTNSDTITQPVASVSGGYYYVSYTNGSFDYYIIENSNVAMPWPSISSSFDIEMYFSVNSDGSLLGDGLTWAADNSSLNDCYYLVDGNGQYIVGDDYHGFWMPDWLSGAGGLGSFNYLTIRKFHNTYYVFMDGVFVQQYDFFPYPGEYFGIKVGNNTAIQVDYYLIWGMDFSSTKGRSKMAMKSNLNKSAKSIGILGSEKSHYPSKNDAIQFKLKK